MTAGALAVAESTGSALAAYTPTEAKAEMRRYVEICEAVLEPSDYQEFPQRKKVDGRWVTVNNKFKKKSAVKKLQTFWGVTVELKSSTREDLPDGHYAWTVVARATARNGRVIEAAGACSTTEERFDLTQGDQESDAAFTARQRKALARAYHDVLSTAETRATNRAVMNCIGVGGGEVTADEISTERNVTPRQQRPAAATAAQPAAAAPSDDAAKIAQERGTVEHAKAVETIQRICKEIGLGEGGLADLVARNWGGATLETMTMVQLRDLWKMLRASQDERP